jgi:hypothetical protein
MGSQDERWSACRAAAEQGDVIARAVLAKLKTRLFNFPPQPFPGGQVGGAQGRPGDSPGARFTNLAERFKIGFEALLIDSQIGPISAHF